MVKNYEYIKNDRYGILFVFFIIIICFVLFFKICFVILEMVSELDFKLRCLEILFDIIFKEKICIKKVWWYVVVVLMFLILGMGIGYFVGYVLYRDLVDDRFY